MYEALKAIAAAYGWPFEYGRSDFQNLFKEVEQKSVSHLFLDPVQVEDIDNDLGVTEQQIQSGSFMLVYSSDIDEIDYDTRYQQYIKPVLIGDMETLKHEIRCGHNVTFGKWQTVEVINMFDYNFDGVLCTFQLTFDL